MNYSVYPTTLPEGVRLIVLPDNHRPVVAVKATHPYGVSVLWELPKRLMNLVEVQNVVVSEILAELNERARPSKDFA